MDQVLEERVDAATAADRQYVWGQRYVDELIVRDRNADASGATGNYGVSGSGLEERLYATNDALYSVTALTNASGTVQERFQYEPYGQAKVLDANFADDGDGVSDVDWEYRFTGRSLDVDTGLDYYRARYYHPTLGRFMGRDPIGYSSDDHNLYRYVGNNPVNRTDPSGLQLETIQRCCGILSRRFSPWCTEEDYVSYECFGLCSADRNRMLAARNTAMNAGLQAGKDLKLEPDSPKDRALRHCVASGVLAAELGNCACAECLGRTRELWQQYYDDQAPTDTQNAIKFNHEGLECAGCTRVRGRHPLTSPGSWATPETFSSQDEIIECCKQRTGIK